MIQLGKRNKKRSIDFRFSVQLKRKKQTKKAYKFKNFSLFKKERPIDSGSSVQLKRSNNKKVNRLKLFSLFQKKGRKKQKGQQIQGLQFSLKRRKNGQYSQDFQCTLKEKKERKKLRKAKRFKLFSSA